MIMYKGRHFELSDLLSINLIKSSTQMEHLPSGSHNMNACMACLVSGPYQHNNHSIYIHACIRVCIYTGSISKIELF